MLFVTETFVVFLAVVLLLYSVAPRRLRPWVVLAACLIFYASWSVPYLFLLLGSVAIDYWLARRAGARDDPASPPDHIRRRYLIASVAINLGALAFFKYSAFAAHQLSFLVKLVDPGRYVPAPELVLPLGISFYVFQALSYSIDVYRGRLAPTDRPMRLALLILFFPHLVAGPIIRARDVLPQFDRLHDPLDTDELVLGAREFVIGFARKVIFADQFALIADATFGDPERFGSATLLLGVLAYAFQIYFDFSGYSQMAIGLARMFGIRFPDNFNVPYIATSLQDFWRRWHISLSTFLRDYLYIPLGGSRQGTLATVGALMATMLLGGLWHGASWTFIAWGAIHGAVLALGLVYRRHLATPAHARFWGSTAGALVGWLGTQLVVAVAWILFRAESFGVAAAYLRCLWRPEGHDSIAVTPLQGALFAAAIAIHVVAAVHRDAAVPWPRRPITAGLLAGAAVALLLVLKGDDAPFLYAAF